MPNAILVNFSAGETSQKSRGRFDLPWYPASCEKLLNFIPEIVGPARYRPGFRAIRETKSGNPARLIPFQLNNTQGYMLEFTNAVLRIYKNGDLLTTSRTTVTAITKANPAVITVVSTAGLANGDDIIITGIVGMNELNNRVVRLAGNSGSTYQLVDPVTGTNINSTAFGTYASGGTLVEVYQIASPYLTADLDDIQFAQNNTVMYLTNPKYLPYKCTVDSADHFTLATYARTSDPFAAGAFLTITDIALAAQGYIQFANGSIINPNVIYTFTLIVGTVELNGTSYYLENKTGGSNPTAYLKTAAGAYVDTSAMTAWASGGRATPAVECPLAVAFYEGRLGFFGTNQRPGAIFLSRTPDVATGAPHYDDFTGGTGDTDAAFFELAPVNGQVNYITWARGTTNYLMVGTFGGPFRLSGGGVDQPISAVSINARQFDSFGCEAAMAVGGQQIYYIQRGGTSIRSPTVTNAYLGQFSAKDLCLNAEHITFSPLVRLAVQIGRPDILWVIRSDGILCGMTVNGAEEVTGWHRQKIGGTAGKVLDVQTLARTDRNDQLFIVSERTVGGITRRSVEYMAEDVAFPDAEEFYAGQDADEDDDLATFHNAVYRRQEEYVHLDGALTYNGTDRGVAAAATLTPGATTGTGITFTASAAVFIAADVGNELWKKPDRETGIGSGRATITAFVSSTVVTCKITSDFNTASAIAAGAWHIAAETIYGLSSLEGQRVAVVTDGAVYADGRNTNDWPTVTVSGGKITLSSVAGVVHVGLPYEGILKSHNLEMGGRSGPAQNKPRNIAQMFIKFMNSLGVDYGTDLYNLNKVEQRDPNAVLDRPAPVFSGARKLSNPDSWEQEKGKFVFVTQRLPLPAVIQYVDVHFDTTDEG